MLHVAGSGLVKEFVPRDFSPKLMFLKIGQAGVKVQNAPWRKTEVITQLSPGQHNVLLEHPKRNSPLTIL
jgi:hypothetical protein